MKTRQLGTLQVSEIGAGAMSISANYGPPADRVAGIRVLREAHQRSVGDEGPELAYRTERFGK